jgi:hypothetical protein
VEARADLADLVVDAVVLVADGVIVVAMAEPTSDSTPRITPIDIKACLTQAFFITNPLDHSWLASQSPSGALDFSIVECLD